MISRDHFPKAIVPNHITPTYLSTLPIEVPVFVNLYDGSDEEYVRRNMFVTADRQLRARCSVEITDDEYNPTSPLGRVGIMRAVLLNDPRLPTGTVADLRYVHAAIPDDEEIPDDQEYMNDWLNNHADSVAIDAFIANDADQFNGAYYGPEAFYPALDMLRQAGNKLFRSYRNRARTGDARSSGSSKRQSAKAAPRS